MKNSALRSHLTIPVLLVSALTIGGCAGKKKKDDPATARKAWLEEPAKGSTAQDVISIPSLGVKFHIPDTLYVFKDCTEASHSPAGPDNSWVPVVQCAPGAGESGDEEEDTFGDDEEEADGSFTAPVTIFAAPKTMVINERAVETFRAKYQHEGWVVDDIGYITDYQSKPGRTGIEMRVHQSSGNEIQRFLWPVGDIMFVVQVEYPAGADRSGLAQDWQRIVWGFQLDEDGPLYPGMEEPEASEPAAEE